MASTEDVDRLGVSTYLLRDSKVTEAWTQLEAASSNVIALNIGVEGGQFVVFPGTDEEPGWVSSVKTLLVAAADVPQLHSQSPGALLWVPRGGKTFLFTFGYAHVKVKDEWVEPDFGKILVQATVPQGQVREVRVEQVFARRHIANERAPRAAAVREFGFEADRDLVASMEGVPERVHQAKFGKRVRGSASFRFELEVAKLAETVDHIIERFDSNEHRSRWPQANTLIQVRDDATLTELEVRLDGVLGGSRASQVVSLAAPAERSGDKPYPQHFVVGRMTANAASEPYLTLSGWQRYLGSTRRVPSVASAKETRVHLLDEDKTKFDDCSMYQCIGAEIGLRGVTHVLSSGTWYAADHRFIQSTNGTLRTIGTPPFALTAWDGIANEGPYNATAAAAHADLWLLDKELISYGGGTSRFEYCDIMHLPTKTLYFVKHPSGSAGVSHLCEQVRRTAEIFFDSDPSYREKLAQKITRSGKGWRVDWLEEQPRRHEWNLCLVLMGKSLRDLPFFAKCGVARLLGELQKRGFNVTFQAV